MNDSRKERARKLVEMARRGQGTPEGDVARTRADRLLEELGIDEEDVLEVHRVIVHRGDDTPYLVMFLYYAAGTSPSCTLRGASGAWLLEGPLREVDRVERLYRRIREAFARLTPHVRRLRGSPRNVRFFYLCAAALRMYEIQFAALEAERRERELARLERLVSDLEKGVDDFDDEAPLPEADAAPGNAPPLSEEGEAPSNNEDTKTTILARLYAMMEDLSSSLEPEVVAHIFEAAAVQADLVVEELAYEVEMATASAARSVRPRIEVTRLLLTTSSVVLEAGDDGVVEATHG